LAPHLGYSTTSTIEVFMEQSLENVKGWLAVR
jgi:hypothetical protein